MTPLVVTAEEAASLLGVSVNTVYALCQRGELRAGRVGRRWLIPRVEVSSWLSRVTGVDLRVEAAVARYDETFSAWVDGSGRR